MTTTLHLEPDIFAATCAARQVLDLIADKWTALVFFALEDGPRRFAELRRRIAGVSQKMLTQTLRDLERNGLVARTVYPTVPPRVDYRLTPLGKTLVEPMTALRRWAEGYISEVERAREAYAALDGAMRQALGSEMPRPPNGRFTNRPYNGAGMATER